MNQKWLQQKYVELYSNLYEGFVLDGINTDRAQALAHAAVDHAKEIIEGVLYDLEYGCEYWVNENNEVISEEDAFGGGDSRLVKEKGDWYCGIRYVFPLEVIADWNVMSDGVKESRLHELGFDTNMPWKEDEGEFVCGGKRMSGQYVVGSERIDNYWTSSKYASMEAILENQGIRHGEDHKRTLESMNRR